MKHTPGPWYATTRRGSWDWLVAHDERNEICQMFHDGTDLNETGEANARLIAAAPDLLAELKGIAETLDKLAPCPEEVLNLLLTRAYKAITKAEGK